MFSSRLIQVIGDSVKQHSPGHFQRLQGQSLIVGSLAVNVRYRVRACSTRLERSCQMSCCAGITIGKELANTPD